MEWFEESAAQKCQSCHSILDIKKPYIKCLGCPSPEIFICTDCFSLGKEFDHHENNHSYTVVRHDFPLFDNWTAFEELALVQEVSECGYGNWADIARRLHPRSESECQHHYNKFYVDNPPSPLPKFPEACISRHPNPIVFKLSEDPPRPPSDSPLAQEMAGYNAARGDFIVEHDDFAEVDVAQLSLNEEEDEQMQDPIIQELKFATLGVYQNCLKERDRRKQVIKDNGLVNLKKNLICNRRYQVSMMYWVDRLKPFMKIHSREKHEEFLEGLHRVQVLKKELKELCEFRRSGLTRLHQIDTFRLLKAKREEAMARVSLSKEVEEMLESKHNSRTALQACFGVDGTDRIRSIILPSARRKPPPPMDISFFPGYDKLSETERELCSSLRFRPEDFLSHKSLLCEEYAKFGYLKLGQARSCLKIDVNKTRKLYDFLLKEGCIAAEC